MLLNPITVHTPTTVEETRQLIAELDNYKIQAGGTFLINTLKQSKKAGRKTPVHIVSLHKVDELKGVHLDDKQLTIQAMTTVSELAAADVLIDNFKIFKKICQNISTHPIRNMATIGGNLTCRYTWTEMPAVMIALNAQLHFIETDGTASACSAEEFFTNNAKTTAILTHITIKRNPDQTASYKRVRKTISVDIPMLSLMITTEIQKKRFTNTRVSINNCVAFAQRDQKLEDFLNTQTVQRSVASAALDHLTEKIYDTRATEYKSHMARVCIKNALLDIMEQHTL